LSEQSFKIAVCGIGFGAAVHVPGLRLIPGVEIVAIAASNRERAAAAASRLGIRAAACGGIEELVDRDLDAVTLALPPDANERALEHVLAHPLAVLSEKPLGCDPRAAESFAHRAKGRTTAVDFEFAELPDFQALKAVAQLTHLGTVRGIDIVWHVQSWAQKNGVWSWKSDARRGGGVLPLLGAHVLYLLEWIFGTIDGVSEATADAAATQRFTPPGEIAAADTISFTLTLPHGVIARVALGNVTSAPPLHRWTVTYEHGALILENRGGDYMSGFHLALRDRSGRTIDSPPPGGIELKSTGDGRIAAFTSLARRFVAAARNNAPCSPDFAAGARVQHWMAAIESAASLDGRRCAS